MILILESYMMKGMVEQEVRHMYNMKMAWDWSLADRETYVSILQYKVTISYMRNVI
jgi:hypothetical protein